MKQRPCFGIVGDLSIVIASMQSVRRQLTRLLKVVACAVFLLVTLHTDSIQGAVRNRNIRINATGIAQEELEHPLKATIKIQNKSKEVLVVPIKIYFSVLPHQIRKQWLIELYDVERDRRLVCTVKQVKWLD